MKDIIRQAVADAAQWLYLNRSTATASYLRGRSAESILKAAKVAMKHDAECARAEQLRQASRSPGSLKERVNATIELDELLHGSPGSESFMAPHAAMVMPQTLIANAAPVLAAIAAKVNDVLVVGPGGFAYSWQPVTPQGQLSKARMQRRADALRAECADAAWLLFDEDGSARDWLIEQEAGAIVKEAGRHKVLTVNVPRDKLEALRDARDGKDGAEYCDLLVAISEVIEYL